jgi:16S rRNA (guanine1207-N2)-methyltransferase
MRIVLRTDSEGQRTEEFLDGAITIVSRNGLNPSQRAILQQLPRGKTGRALVVNSDYAVLALAMKAANSEMQITSHYLDAWDADVAKATLAAHADAEIELSVAPDPPAGPWDYVVLPLERRGIADFVREQIRMAAAEWLAPKGLLLTSSDTKEDRFIRDEVKKAFGAMHTAPEDKRRGGVAYVARRPAKMLVAPPRSWTSFTVRGRDEILTFESRIGVFCHDRLDDGTRALLAYMDVTGAKRILDLGCGSGLVGTIAAKREPNAAVTFVDSNARAIESTQRNIERHAISERVSGTLLTANPTASLGGQQFDRVLTNPPYYGNWRIAELFVQTAREALVPSGEIHLVTKAPEWYREHLASDFENLREESRAGYTIVLASRK